MDPNETLRIIRRDLEVVNKYRDLKDRTGGLLQWQREEFEAAAGSLAEGVEAMDEWISKGGFLPGEWQH